MTTTNEIIDTYAYTVAQIVTLTGLSRDSIYRSINEGVLRKVNVPGWDRVMGYTLKQFLGLPASENDAPYTGPSH